MTHPTLQRFYNSREWRQMRTRIRHRDHNRCVHPDCPTPTLRLQVNHRTPLDLPGTLGWARRLDPTNLETVCKGHHDHTTMQQRIDAARTYTPSREW